MPFFNHTIIQTTDNNTTKQQKTTMTTPSVTTKDVKNLVNLEYAFKQLGMPKGFANMFRKEVAGSEHEEIWKKIVDGLVVNIEELKQDKSDELKRLLDIEKKYEGEYYCEDIANHPYYDDVKDEIEEEVYERYEKKMCDRDNFIMEVHNLTYGTEYNDHDIVSSMDLDAVLDKIKAVTFADTATDVLDKMKKLTEENTAIRKDNDELRPFLRVLDDAGYPMAKTAVQALSAVKNIIREHENLTADNDNLTKVMLMVEEELGDDDSWEGVDDIIDIVKQLIKNRDDLTKALDLLDAGALDLIDEGGDHTIISRFQEYQSVANDYAPNDEKNTNGYGDYIGNPETLQKYIDLLSANLKLSEDKVCQLTHELHEK